mgnify:CR=1 FL=1
MGALPLVVPLAGSRVAYAGYQIPEVVGTHARRLPRFVEARTKAGLSVQVWTVDTEEAASIDRLGVDAR